MINRYLGGGHNLLAAYFATRERQYLERYVHLWLSWYRRARPPQRKPSTKYGGCVWQPLQVGIRVVTRMIELGPHAPGRPVSCPLIPARRARPLPVPSSSRSVR